MHALDRLYDLPPGAARILHTETSGGRLLEVREFEQFRWLVHGGTAIQSVMRIDRPAQPMMQTHLAMLCALLVREQAVRVLNLGLGGGAFERFFADRFPQAAMTSVEVSDAVIRLADEFFRVDGGRPGNHQIVYESADAYLAQSFSQGQAPFDIILSDLFSGEDHPACLTDNDFYSNVCGSLDEPGVFAMNVSPSSEQVLFEILLPLREQFRHTLMIDIANHGNMIVIAMNRAPPSDAALAARARELSPVLGIDLVTPLDALRRLPPTAMLVEA